MWVEVRRWQCRVGKPKFVKLGDEHQYQGFRSVYAYDDAARAVIEAAGSTAGIDHLPVYSDQLFLDFDDVDPAATLVHLYDEGHAFTLWNSGNRSVHVHVALEPMRGTSVPYSQRRWVEQHAPNADVTFYHHAGQYRLPDTPHEKTGRRKLLVATNGGSCLTIPLVVRPALAAVAGTSRAAPALAAKLLRARGTGGRRQYAWHLAMAARSEGLELALALQQILWWNQRYAIPPLDPNVVSEKVHEVYRSRP